MNLDRLAAQLRTDPAVRWRGELRCRPPERTCDDADIRAALRAPILPAGTHGNPLDRFRPGERICIVVSDQTRRTAADRILPVLLEELAARGCRESDLWILVATGTHRAPTPDELARILGPVATRFENRTVSHRADEPGELVQVGTTSRGHPVRVNRLAMECDRRIAIGSVTHHYHAGFGGGRKAFVPGIAARETVAWNHSLTLDDTADRIRPGVEPGQLDGNPVHEEMLEGARLCRPDLIINTVLTPRGEIAGVFSGDLDAAHRAACRLADQLFRVELDAPADLVLADAAGAPNWIQAHKALFNAARARSPRGTILLHAPCPEGLGNERFRHWVRMRDLREIFRGLRESVEVNGQTALSTRTHGAHAVLLTGMNAGDVADLGIRTAPTANHAFDEFMAGFRRAHPGETPTCLWMPEARYTLPGGSAIP